MRFFVECHSDVEATMQNVTASATSCGQWFFSSCLDTQNFVVALSHFNSLSSWNLKLQGMKVSLLKDVVEWHLTSSDSTIWIHFLNPSDILGHLPIRSFILYRSALGFLFTCCGMKILPASFSLGSCNRGAKGVRFWTCTKSGWFTWPKPQTFSGCGLSESGTA